jgi:MerR family transcriptional regulator, redox-sensitive transcriptional activator SoxR
VGKRKLIGELEIGEVAAQAGVQPSALRYYESIGLLPAPRRVNGRRRFDPSVLQRLAVIRVAKEAGFTISEIQTFLDGFEPDTPLSTRWRGLAEKKLAEIDALILRAETMKGLLQQGLNCGCMTFEDCPMFQDVECEGAGA